MYLSSQLAAVIRNNLWLVFLLGGLGGVNNLAYAGPSVPYMPTWQARHHLERLVDEAGLQITTTHWPLPLSAVQDALDDLPNDLSPSLEESKAYVTEEINDLRRHGRVDVQLRNRAEAPVGFGENYTPGSSLRLSSAANEFGSIKSPIVARIGIRIEQNPNSLQTTFTDGWGKNSLNQIKLDNTALVAEFSGINVQAFAHQNWWGPGWESSLINSNNIPPWVGVGVQRSEVKPSASKLLSWMGPWSFEMYVARARDPIVVVNQPDGFYFIGTRLTLKPWSWLEIGLTRDIQTGGTGRPSGLPDILKAAFTGGSTHTFTGNTQQDLSNSVAGYDARLNCPKGAHCAIYFQWMGEDASGQSHLPNEFMTLAGLDWWSTSGRHRVFTEYMQTYTSSFPWNTTKRAGFAYRNWAYPQGFTNGGRWIGSSFGGDARILTMGWLDAESSRMLKIYSGETSTALGSYNPNTNATGNLIGPHGRLVGFSAQQGFKWNAWSVVPEFDYIHLAEGQTIGVNKTTDVRAGVTFSRSLWGD
jgi:hypothetical protein